MKKRPGKTESGAARRGRPPGINRSTDPAYRALTIYPRIDLLTEAQRVLEDQGRGRRAMSPLIDLLLERWLVQQRGKARRREEG